MCKLINLLQGSKSLYGYCQTDGKSSDERVVLDRPGSIQTSPNVHVIHETLYSLLLSIFPSILHKFKSSDLNLMKYDDKNMTILATTLAALHHQAGYNIPQV